MAAYFDDVDTTSRRVRFAHYFTVAYIVLALIVATGLRDSVLFATTRFSNAEVGIVAYYPANWLLDTSTSVMRATDVSQREFKTVIEISVLPFGPRMSARNIIDDLTFSRRESLPYYRSLTTFPSLLRSQDEVVVNEYTFVSALTDPFLVSVPTVVIGRDVAIERRNQVILVTFQADARVYANELAVFERFLDTLEY